MGIEEFFDNIISVKLTEGGELNIIDQTLLPGEIKRINLNTKTSNGIPNIFTQPQSKIGNITIRETINLNCKGNSPNNRKIGTPVKIEIANTTICRLSNGPRTLGENSLMSRDILISSMICSPSY